MIEFTDSFSQAAVAEAMCAHPELARLITHQLQLPTFTYEHDAEGRRTGGPIVQPNPSLLKTLLYVSTRDMRGHLPREIGFARYQCPCDSAGQPSGPWQRQIVGAYFNHGTNEHPNWSSHT